MTNVIAQAAVGLERIQTILDADTIIPRKARRARPGQDQGRDRFRACRLRLRPRRAGAARHQPHDQARPAHRRLRPDRRRQIDRPQPYPSLLRSDEWPRAGRWRGCHRLQTRRPARADRFRPAGHRPLRRHDPRQHRLRPARRDARGNHRSGEDGQRARVHLADAARLRLAGRRTRPHALGRPAPAHRHCPRGRAQLTRSSSSTSRPPRSTPSRRRSSWKRSNA